MCSAKWTSPPTCLPLAWGWRGVGVKVISSCARVLFIPMAPISSPPQRISRELFHKGTPPTQLRNCDVSASRTSIANRSLFSLGTGAGIVVLYYRSLFYSVLIDLSSSRTTERFICRILLCCCWATTRPQFPHSLRLLISDRPQALRSPCRLVSIGHNQSQWGISE